MKTSTKKRIAKEVLILFSCTVLIFLFWIFSWARNITIDRTSEKLQNQITQLTYDYDSIKWAFPMSVDTLTIFYKNDSVDVAVKDIGSLLKHFPEADNEIRDLYEKTNSFQDTNTEDSWAAYIRIKSELGKLNTELAITKSKIQSSQDLIVFTKWFGILLFAVVYPFRFIFLLLSWAINTLRENKKR